MSDYRPSSDGQTNLLARSSSYRLVYADAFSIKASAVDLGVTFGTSILIPVPAPGGRMAQGTAVQEEVTVTMTLPVLKAFLLNLSKIIETIEGVNGPIRVPQSLLPTEDRLETVRQNLRNNPLV